MDAHAQRAGGYAVLGSPRLWVVDGADDVRTCAALLGDACLEIGIRWNPGSRRQSERASAPNYESSRRIITCRAALDAITE